MMITSRLFTIRGDEDEEDGTAKEAKERVRKTCLPEAEAGAPKEEAKVEASRKAKAL